MNYFTLETLTSNDSPAVQLLHAIHQCNVTSAQHIIYSHPNTVSTPCGEIQITPLHVSQSKWNKLEYRLYT